MKIECVDFKKNYYKHDNLLTLKFTPSKWEKFFGAKEETVKYIGSSTVFYTFPDFERSNMDYELTQINKKQEYLYNLANLK